MGQQKSQQKSGTGASRRHGGAGAPTVEHTHPGSPMEAQARWSDQSPSCGQGSSWVTDGQRRGGGTACGADPTPEACGTPNLVDRGGFVELPAAKEGGIIVTFVGRPPMTRFALAGGPGLAATEDRDVEMSGTGHLSRPEWIEKEARE